jgi:hypothetical protein
MKKLFVAILLVFITSMAFSQFPAPYCGPLVFPSEVEPITLVNFAGINNVTSAAVNSADHENFIVQTASVTAGQSYPISLKGNTVGEFTTTFAVFIDWNQDADFDDLNESFYIGDIFNSTGTDTTTLLGNISVPSFVRGGITRLRVVKTYTDNDPSFYPMPCSNISPFGQAEDYSINVTAIPQCLIGTKFPTNTINNLLCDGSNTIVSTISSTNNYFEFVVVQGKDYKLASSITSDHLTISNKNASITYVAGSSPLIWKAEVSDTVRVYLHSNITCGIDTLKRITSIGCGLDCLNGNLFPTQTFVPAVCDDITQNIISTIAHTGEYSNVQIVKGSTYTFSTGVNTDIITLSLDGEYVTYKGNSPLFWRADTSSVIRFYANTDANCNVDTILRTKSVVCKALELPGCVTNMYPANGDTMYVSVAQYDFGFDPPSSGGDIESYIFNVGLDTLTTFYTVEIPPVNVLQVTFDATDANKTYYWWMVAKNAAGTANCNPIKHKMLILAKPPVGINTITQGGFSAYPNPVEQYVSIVNNTEIDKIEIINVVGQTVAVLQVNTFNVKVDMTDFSSGVYQLKLTTSNNELKVLKIMKK